jgi:hypothetical protein
MLIQLAPVGQTPDAQFHHCQSCLKHLESSTKVILILNFKKKIKCLSIAHQFLSNKLQHVTGFCTSFPNSETEHSMYTEG